MKVKSKNFVYECLPPFLNNRLLPVADRIIIGLTVIPLPEQDMFQREVMQIRSDYALDKAQEMIEEKTRALVGKHFKYISGLEIEGFDGELTFETFYQEAPPELVGWVTRAVMSTTELSTSERKNFEPE